MTTNEAFVIGVSRGWDHANFADAYTTSGASVDDADTTEVPGHYDADAFREGFRLGIERFQGGLWQDGTAVTSD